MPTNLNTAVRKASIVILFVFCWSLFFTTTASAATIYSNSSTGNDTTGDGSSGTPYASFHKAYTQAASSGDIINLTGTFDWTNLDESGDSTNSGYTLAKSLTIQGQAADSTFIQASSTVNTADRPVFTVSSGKTVTVKDLTVRYGVATASNTGGGFTNNGTLNIENSNVSYSRYNSSSSDGAGGIFLPNSASAVLNISTSTIAYNTFNARLYGAGGVYAGQSNTMTIIASTFHNNESISTIPTTYAFSYADPAGALGQFRFTTTVVTNSTFTNNTTNSYGGALNIYYPNSFKITNSTIANNNADAGAGGILFDSSSNSYQLHLENTILANNTGNGSANDFHVISAASGRITDNGYNIVEYSTNKTWSGTGVLTGNQASLNLSATLADNSATNGVQTLALSAGSVAINAGTTTANSSIAVPSTDQRGGTRSGATDIGAYEYSAGGFADVTVPTATLTAPSSSSTVSGANVSLTASATDNVAVAGVSFYIDDVLQGSEDTSSTYEITWDSTAVSEGSHTAFSVTRDTSNNYATSTSVSFTVDNVSPTISAVSAVAATTTATITWVTSEAASTLVNIGLTSSYGSSTSETDTSTRVTSHSASLTSLVACSVYHYQARSIDSVTNTATSSDATFETTGCTGGTNISATSQNGIATSTGGTLTRGDLSITVPTSFTATSSSAVFQISQLGRSSFLTAASTPSGVIAAGSDIFHLAAFTDFSTKLETFDQAITLTLSYLTTDITDITESTLKIYRYNSGNWSALSSCTVDTNAKTVTCTTTAFSDFGIFGESAPAESVAVAGNGPLYEGPVSDLPDYITPRTQIVYPDGTIVYLDDVRAPTVPATKDALALLQSPTHSVLGSNKTTIDISIFTRDLYRGVSGDDVLALQKILNQNGFTITENGYGAPGEETTFFGKLTRDALIRYQVAQDIKPSYGYFGPITRKNIYLHNLVQNY